MIRRDLVLLAIPWLTLTSAAAETIEGQFRSRPPEMVIGDGGQLSGPLMDVINEAFAANGLTITWHVIPFARSLEALRNGEPVLVPRIRREAEREAFVRFLGPIAIQHRVVKVAARTERSATIKGYEDLKSLKVATLRGSATFPRFDRDDTIEKQVMTDDVARARLLQGGRVDAIISSDPVGLALAFDSIKFSDWAWAPYQIEIDGGNYYGISRSGPLIPSADALDATLKQMVESGRVRAIYHSYGLNPDDIVD